MDKSSVQQHNYNNYNSSDCAREVLIQLIYLIACITLRDEQSCSFTVVC